MKKIIAMVTLLAAGAASAQQKIVNVVWPFAPASTQAVMIRTLIDSANVQQSKYSFVFQNKPGAGGSIAVNSVLQSDTLTVLASSSSFYSRPMLYNDSHNVERFALVGQICEQGPLGLFSRKYTSLDQLKNKEVTFGITPGSITQVVVDSIARSVPNFKVLQVPYKDTVASTTDMLGLHLDVAADMTSAGTLARMTPDTHLLAVTGSRSYNGVAPFKGLEGMTNSYLLFVPKEVDAATRRELNSIFTQAINQKLRDACKDEGGVVAPVAFDKLESVNDNYKQTWVNITRHLPKQ